MHESLRKPARLAGLTALLLLAACGSSESNGEGAGPGGRAVMAHQRPAGVSRRAARPGRQAADDRAALKIYPTGSPNSPVLNVPLQLLTSGNLQAHYDQPHK